MEWGRKSKFKSLTQSTVFPLWVSKKYFKIHLPAKDLFKVHLQRARKFLII